MANIYKAKIKIEGKKVAIVCGKFNSIITEQLLGGAIENLVSHGCDENNIDVFWVPGAFEIPSTTKALVGSGKYDGIICLGAVIRGDTPHFDFVAAEATKGIGQISLNSDIPVIFGVLTTNTVEQAMNRAGAKSGNKGWDSAMCLMEMIDIRSQIKNIK